MSKVVEILKNTCNMCGKDVIIEKKLLKCSTCGFSRKIKFSDNDIKNFSQELLEILEEDILERYNNPEYWSFSRELDDELSVEDQDPDDMEEDILERYNNSEYWKEDMIKDFQHEKGLSDLEMKAVKEYLP